MQTSRSYIHCFGLCHSQGRRQLNLLWLHARFPRQLSTSGLFMSFPFESVSGEASGLQEWQHHIAMVLTLVMLPLFPASFLRSNDSPSTPKSQRFLLCLIYPCTRRSTETLTSVFNRALSFQSNKMSECDLPYFTNAILPFNLITAKYQVPYYFDAMFHQLLN